MTSGQKIAFSLLTAFALFAAFVLSFQSRLFKELETKFYTQSKIEDNKMQLDSISESCDSYIKNILTLIENGDSAWVKQPAVRSYYVQNPSESDINERRRLTEQLFSQIPSLKAIRIVDKNARNVHFSTFDDTDILKQNGITKIYKNYPDIQKDADELPFELIEKNITQNKSSILFDSVKNRLIVYVPFYWMDDIYSGLCLFYLNVYDIEKALISNNVVSIGQGFNLFADENLSGGFVVNVPSSLSKQFKEPVLKYWKNNVTENKSQNPEKLLEIEGGKTWVAISGTKGDLIKITGVYTSDCFEIGTETKIVIYICIFISILLIVFLIFSFRRDPVVTLKKRIKKIQFAIIDEYLENKEKIDWSYVTGQLKSRKKEFTDEILKSLNVHSKKRKGELDAFLEKNWDEIFSIFENKAKTSEPAVLNGATIEEIRKVLEEVLQNTVIKTTAPVVQSKPVSNVAEVADADEVEELEEEVADADEVEELEPEVTDADEVEELEEEVADVDEVEELEPEVADADEVEELEEEVADADEVEELEPEVADVDEVEELEHEVADADEVEELEEEVTDADEVEELEEEVTDVDEVEELEEEVTDADEVEELEEEVTDVDEVEELEEEVTDVDEVEELEHEVADADEVEELEEEVADADEVEELEEEVADVDEVEEIDELIDEVEEPEVLVDDVEELEDAGNVEPTQNLTDKIQEIDDVEELIDDVEELEDVEQWKDNVNKDFDSTLQLLRGAEYKYKESNDTYIDNGTFADVDNLFAEELDLSCEYTPMDKSMEQFTFEVYPLNCYEDEIQDSDLPVLDDMFYSMTRFGDNFSNEMPELEEVSKNEDTIIEKDGVFSISENIEYSGVTQNEEFKELVDSVL